MTQLRPSERPQDPTSTIPRTPPAGTHSDHRRAERMRSAYAAHRDAIWRYFVRRIDCPDLAEDLTSEVFVVAWRRQAVVSAAAPELPWLYGVARKVLANDRRANGRRAALARRLADQASVARQDAVGDEVDRLIANATYLAALARLRQVDREVLLLAGWEGLEPAEIAVALGCRAGTARARLHRARRRLSDLLDPNQTEGTPT